MYPLDTSAPYVRNVWYVAAYGHEISRQLMERTLLDEVVVFYRTEDGRAVAMKGLCPHRFYPLVKGTVIGDTIQCSYHGLTFDADGRCTRIPSQSDVPRRFCNRVFPTVEHGPLVWIWMGDPSLADPSLVPKPDCFDFKEYEFNVLDCVHVACRVQLLIDNLFDLGHIDYLHAKTIPGTHLSEVPVSILDRQGDFRVVRECRNEEYDGYATFLFGEGEGRIDFDAPTDFHGPALIVSGSIHDRRERHGSASGGGAMRYVHALTPETACTTHYFGGSSRNFRLDDKEFTAIVNMLDVAVRKEDADALAAIEHHLDQFASAKAELSVRADAGSTRVRRMIAEMIRKEAGSLTPSPD